MGGAEFHAESLIKHFDPKRMSITQCVVTNKGLVLPHMVKRMGVPVRIGEAGEVRLAVAQADVMLCWGGAFDDWLVDLLPKPDGSEPQKKFPLTIFLAHGDGAWTRKAMEGSRRVINHVVAVSNRVRDMVCTGFPTTVIPNGIDLARIAPTMSRKSKRLQLGYAESDFVIGYFGRFSDEKRPEAVVESLEFLPNNYKTLMVGRGNEEPKLRKIAEQFPGRVQFHEADGDIGDYYSAADCLVSPSREEGFGLSILEAMFSELPVIATPVGAVPEILKIAPYSIRGTDGTPESIADEINYLDEAPPSVQLAKDYAEKYGYARDMAGKYMDLIESLWREKQAKRGSHADSR